MATAPPSSPPSTAPSTASTLLPPPQTFDILPPLHAILSRLAPATTTAGTTTTAAAAGAYPDQAPLEPHQLAAEVSAVKIRIQKARAAVQSLPDMSRSVEEQEAEIKQLEERVRMQREVLANLKEKAAS